MYRPIKTNLLNHELLAIKNTDNFAYCISEGNCDYLRIYNMQESEILNADVDDLLYKHEKKFILFDAQISKNSDESLRIEVAYSIPLLGFVYYEDNEYYLADRLYAVVRGKLRIPVTVTPSDGIPMLYIGDASAAKCITVQFPDGSSYEHNNFSDYSCGTMCMGTIQRRWSSLSAMLKTVLMATAIPTSHAYRSSCDECGTRNILENFCIPRYYFTRRKRLDFSVISRVYNRSEAIAVGEEIRSCLEEMEDNYDDDDDDY